MTPTPKPIEIHDSTSQRRFEAPVGDSLAMAFYEIRGKTIVFTHTEVPEAARGHGIGSQLVVAALESARQRGLTVTPQCPMFAAYMKKHPETQDILSDEGRAMM